jgi:hypothetical protein
VRCLELGDERVVERTALDLLEDPESRVTGSAGPVVAPPFASVVVLPSSVHAPDTSATVATSATVQRHPFIATAPSVRDGREVW